MVKTDQVLAVRSFYIIKVGFYVTLYMLIIWLKIIIYLKLTNCVNGWCYVTMENGEEKEGNS